MNEWKINWEPPRWTTTYTTSSTSTGFTVANPTYWLTSGTLTLDDLGTLKFKKDEPLLLPQELFEFE